MTELTLIILLAAAVVFLSVMIIVRHYRTKKSLLLNEKAVNELLESVFDNLAAGKTGEVVEKVPHILKKFLKCDKIAFLRYNKLSLKPDYLFGLGNIGPSELHLKIKDGDGKKLTSFRRIAPISGLQDIIDDDSFRLIKSLGLKYFFPVFMRDKLYGIFLASTSLSADDASLNFIATALANNLSSAYHMGRQAQRIKRYESRLKNMQASHGKLSDKTSESVGEILHYLSLKNCRQLLPELLKSFKRDCNFSRLGFYVRTGPPENELITVKLNIEEKSDNILKEKYDSIVECLKTMDIFELKDLSNCRTPIENNIKVLSDDGINYLIPVSWVEGRKAILAVGGRSNREILIARLRRFEREALPLVESVRRFEKVEEMSYTDVLTGIYNIRFFRKKIVEEFSRARRYDRFMALLILDIDDLKTINDKYGHQAGDLMLKSIGVVLSESIRANDIISRYGGDEFCLLMPEADRSNAELFMERIRNRIAAKRPLLKDGKTRLELTVSIGGAVYPDDASTIDDLIHAADMALLKAKKEGRNCSKMYRAEFGTGAGDEKINKNIAGKNSDTNN